MPLLVEKYRPKTIDDVVGFDKSRITLDDSIPHLLLSGPPGTGKTSLARVIINTLKCNYIILNSSDERGINTIREKVKAFASTQSNDKNIKICILDEADALTNEAQDSLRNMMEVFSGNCRFVLTANYANKVIAPLKSRCVSIEFNKINPAEIVKRLEFICKNENIPYEVSALEKIVNLHGSDIRRSVNKLEELRDGVFLDKIITQNKLSEDIFNAIKEKNFEKARQLYLNAHPDPEEIVKDLHDTIWNSSESMKYKEQAITDIADYYKFLSSAAWKEIVIEAIILKLIKSRG